MNNEISEKVLQEKILTIFKEFKRICDKYGLTYYAIGGTCIGAVRHHGFIPWDDDLDVAMPLDDYYKFIKLAPSELNNGLALFEYLNNKDNNLTFLKIHDTNTTFIEDYLLERPEGYRGIYIDIMPISGISKNEFLKKIHIKKLQCCFSLNNYKKGFSNSSNKLLNFVKNVICDKVDANCFIRKYDKLIRKYPFEEKNNVFFTWRIHLRMHYSDVFDYQWFKETLEVPFEDTTIKIPCGYDQYLKKDFGDYMKLPPKEKRVSNHNVEIIDLDKSYKLYANAKQKEIQENEKNIRQI